MTLQLQMGDCEVAVPAEAEHERCQWLMKRDCVQLVAGQMLRAMGDQEHEVLVGSTDSNSPGASVGRCSTRAAGLRRLWFGLPCATQSLLFARTCSRIDNPTHSAASPIFVTQFARTAPLRTALCL